MKRLLLPALCAIALWFPAVAPAEDVPKSLLQPKDRILLIGDSITGQGRGHEVGWSNQFDAALAATRPGDGIVTVSLGGSGMGVGAWLNTMKRTAEPDPEKPVILDVKSVNAGEELKTGGQVVLIMLGMNDALFPNVRDTPEGLAKWKEDYRALIAQLRERTRPRVVVLVSPTPCTDDPASPKNVVLRAFGTLLQELAKEEGCLYAPAHETAMALLDETRTWRPDSHATGDQVHPHSRAQHMPIATAMLRALGEPAAAQKLEAEARATFEKPDEETLSWRLREVPTPWDAKELKWKLEVFYRKPLAPDAKKSEWVSIRRDAFRLPDGWKLADFRDPAKRAPLPEQPKPKLGPNGEWSGPVSLTLSYSFIRACGAGGSSSLSGNAQNWHLDLSMSETGFHTDLLDYCLGPDALHTLAKLYPFFRAPMGWKGVMAYAEFELTGTPERLVNAVTIKVGNATAEIPIPAPWLIGTARVGGLGGQWERGMVFHPETVKLPCDEALSRGRGFGQPTELLPAKPAVEANPAVHPPVAARPAEPASAIEWSRHTPSLDYGGGNAPGAVDFAGVLFFRQFDVAWGARWIYSDKEQPATVRVRPLGFVRNEFVAVWLNAAANPAPLFAAQLNDKEAAAPEKLAIPVTLKKGWNSLTFRSHNWQVQWQFAIDLEAATPQETAALRVTAVPPGGGE